MSTVNTDSVSGALGPLSPLTLAFSSNLAQPLKAALPKTYSPGYSGSPRAFFNSILINGDKQLRDCSSQPFKSIDGSPCAYMDNLLYCVVIGIVIPVVTVIYCCGFFCARNGGDRCRCCGSMCRQPNCGGKYPTISKYSVSETRCCCCAFLLNWVVICLLAVLGFLSTNAASQDIQLVVDSLNSARSFAPTYKATISTRLNEIKSTSLSSLDASNVNGRLVLFNQYANVETISKFKSVRWQDSVVSDTATKVQEASLSMSSLLARFIDTCDGLSCPTNPPDFSKFQNSSGRPATFNSEMDRWIVGSTPLAAAITCCPNNSSWSGSPHNYSEAYYQNGDLKPDDCIVSSPAIQSKLNSLGGWLCCRLQASKSNLDRMKGAVQSLNKAIDRNALGGAITALASPINSSIDSFDSSMSKINSILLQSSQALTNQAAIVGGSATVWTLAIISVSCSIFGLFLSISCCWWTSYCLGVVNVIIFFVLFGAFALIALPFGDICSGIPKTADSVTIQQTWLLTFSAQGRLSDLKPESIGIYTGCLIPKPPSGNLFRVTGRDKNNITGGLKLVAGDLNVSDLSEIFNVGSYTNLFAKSVDYITSNFSTVSTVQSALRSAVTSIQDLNGKFLSESILIGMKFLTVLRMKAATSFALISGIIDDRTFVLGNTSDMIWNTANCSGVNNLYEAVRQPLCNRMSKSLDSIWVLFFFIGVAWFPMFLIICRSCHRSCATKLTLYGKSRSSKHSLARKGVYDVPLSALNDDDLNLKDMRDNKDEHPCKIIQGMSITGIEHMLIRCLELQESGNLESSETPVDGSIKVKEKKKKSKKKSSTASSHAASVDDGEDTDAMERKMKAK